MPRKPKPFLHEGWYKADAGGPPRTKLCKEEEGLRRAELCLNRWLVRFLEAKEQGVIPAGMTPAAYLQAVDAGQAVPAPSQVPSQASAGAAKPAAPTTNPALAGPRVILLGEVHDEFLDFHLKKAVTDKERETYTHYVNKLKPLVDQFGNRPINSITEDDGWAYRKWLRTEKPWVSGKTKKKGVGPCTTNHCVRAAKTFFNWVCKPKHHHKYGLLYNPWVDIEYFPEKGRERVITDVEFASLLRNASDDDFRAILLVLRHTTMRPKELRLLDWDYIRWDVPEVVYPPEVIKTNNRRAFTLIEQSERVLAERKKRLEAEGKKARGLVFPSIDGEVWKKGSFSQKFRRLRERCARLGEMEMLKGGERLVMYSSRHTRITEMHVEGVDPVTIQLEAGHTKKETTDRYTHLIGKFRADRVRQRSGKRVGDNDDAGSGT